MPRPALITYEGLPDSAHVLRGSNLVKHWTATQAFLCECTDFTKPKELQIRLVHGRGIPRDFSAPIIRELTDRFGDPRTPPPFAGTLEENSLWWHPSFDQLLPVIEWAASLRPYPKHWLGSPLSVGMEASRLKLLHHETREVLPFQGNENYNTLQPLGGDGLLGESYVFLRLGAESSFCLLLSLPFESPSPEFMAQVAFIQSRLPFRLSRSHWKRWQLNKAGNRYRALKLKLEAGSA